MSGSDGKEPSLSLQYAAWRSDESAEQRNSLGTEHEESAEKKRRKEENTLSVDSENSYVLTSPHET
jgi:hypothetical protein